VGHCTNLSLTDPNIVYDSIKFILKPLGKSRLFYRFPTRKEYRIEYNLIIVRGYIGNNRAGLIPSAGATILITYRIGEGVRGNIVSR